MNMDRKTEILHFPACRTVVTADARIWLSDHQAASGTSVITSLPDTSELTHLDFAAWQAWFVEAAVQIIGWLPADGVAIFFQSDIRHAGQWIDKGYLILKAAELAGAHLVWHKIACRKPPGTISQGRPTYSHMICLAPTARPAPTRTGPDVIADAGHQTWPRAMGVHACRIACRFLRDETPTRIVVDPFCGEGSVLAVANECGFETIGVDLSARRCRVAACQTLRVSGHAAL